MKTVRNCIAVFTMTMVVTVGCTMATNARRGSLDEAREMLDRAVVHYATVGRDQALRDFTARKRPFFDRDLYVFCYGPDRKISAHGADSSLLGTEIDGLRDVDGTAFGTEIMRVAQSSPEGGFTGYKWRNPATGSVESKVSIVRVVGSDVCGVGAYAGD